MKRIVLFIMVVIGFSSCKDSDKSDLECTKVYMAIPLRLQYEDKSPVVLDSFIVKWGERDITRQYSQEEFERARKVGSYTIVDDGMQEELQNLSVSVLFTGYIDNKIVHKGEYVVGADECHVVYLGNKPLDITINGEIVNCTDIFMGYVLKVQYEDESPVVLDSYKVFWDNKDITPKSTLGVLSKGNYLFVNDDLTSELNGLSEEITFVGFKDGKEIARDNFLFGADKCHIHYLEERPLLIIVNE